MPVCASCGQENPERFRFCGVCGAVLAPAAAERRKLATLLFCDMSGSTAMGERVDAESVRELMLRYFHTMRGAIERHGGTVEKFAGDAVMAVFGVPVAREDDALRAVRAAWEMQQRLGELNEELEARFGTRVALRIGVNTGEVVAGDASSRQTMVTGDAVNVAARLEQHATPGEILLGPETYRLVCEAVSTEPVEPIAAKGKSEPVPAYRLVSAPAPVARRRADVVLVGRESELAVLRSAWDGVVADRACRLLTVAGEPGVGKSRLARELVAGLGPRALVLHGRCLPYGEGITYWPVAQIARQAAAVHDEDSAEQAQHRLAALVSDDPDGPLVAERVAQAIGLGTGQAAAEEVAWAIRRLLASLARIRPALVVVDDLQWGETALLQVLASLPGRVAEPLLVLCLARPELSEDVAEWEVAVRLEPLGEEEAAALVPAELAGLSDRIVRTAGGNPLFVEELAAMLADDPGAEQLPTSLAALLGARLDRLPSEERDALERASVEGEVFHRGAVSALAGRDVTAELARLSERKLVQPERAEFVGEAAFRFRHLLMRDAAYGGAAKKLRAELHERFGDWLEAKAGDRISEFEAILGYHLEQALRYRAELGPLPEDGSTLAGRAGGHLAAAGLRALSSGDMRGAVNLLSRAVALLPRDGRERAALLPRLGRGLKELGDLPRAEETLLEAVQAARVAAIEPAGLEAEIELASVRVQRAPAGIGDLARIEATLPALERLGDDRLLGRALGLIGEYHASMRARFRLAEQALERALEYVRRADDRLQESDVIFWLAASARDGPMPVPLATRRCERLLERSSGGPLLEANARFPLAYLRAMDARFDEARDQLAAVSAAFQDLGLVLGDIGVTGARGEIELLAGEYERAEQYLRSAYEALGRMGEKGWRSFVGGHLAHALFRLDRLEEARGIVVTAKGLTVDEDVVSQLVLRPIEARLLAAAGEVARAEVVARSAVRMADETDALILQGDALLSLAEVLRAGGRSEEAASEARRALDLYERKEHVVAIGRARLLLRGLEAAV